MSGHERLWELLSLGWEEACLRVCAACTAGELAVRLLPSKPAVARAFARGQLRVAGATLTREACLEPGDVVALVFHRALEVTSPSVAASLDVLYCDPVMMAVDKPAGLLVHGDGSDADTLTERVRAWLALEGHEGVRPQAIQRLDVDTTGLVLFSLAEEFQAALDAQVAGHAIHKRYLAITRRAPSGARKGWVELAGPIARDRHDARKMRVGRSGKPALTRVREWGRAAGRSLLEVELVTGRKHQIRVHLAHAGCPIDGDRLYGGAHSDAGLMLHAWQEQVIHPVTGEHLQLQTSWPERFGDVRVGAAPKTSFD